MRVDCYWNLHRGGYSIRAAEGPDRGRVIAYTSAINLIDATFVVREPARQRILRTRRKEVHAWIVGHITMDDFDTRAFPAVTYNPYRESTFVTRADRKPVHAAQRVALETRDGKPSVWVVEGR
jgi:hypothetical protein